MDKVSHCPVCNELWHTMAIPPEYHENHSPPYYYSTVIAVSDWETDSPLYYLCPDCGTKFDTNGNISNTNDSNP